MTREHPRELRCVIADDTSRKERTQPRVETVEVVRLCVLVNLPADGSEGHLGSDEGIHTTGQRHFGVRLQGFSVAQRARMSLDDHGLSVLA